MYRDVTGGWANTGAGAGAGTGAGAEVVADGGGMYSGAVGATTVEEDEKIWGGS